MTTNDVLGYMKNKMVKKYNLSYDETGWKQRQTTYTLTHTVMNVE